MSIRVVIPDPLAEMVARAAASKGKSPEAVVIEAVETQLDPFVRLNAALAPIRQAYQQSGFSEDEAVELFEAEKHAMRKERVKRLANESPRTSRL
ncbi:MAG TPA: hypothetical protein VGJ26_21700 [Pirellulales bacterium]|jgi:hypothetical protein